MPNSRWMLVALLAVSACSSDQGPADSPTLSACTNEEVSVEVSGEMGSKPSVTIPDGDPPCELQVEDIEIGTGPEAVAGSSLRMQYTGISWSTKEQFDASWDRGDPFSFTLGTGNVITGWDQGIRGMKQGGRRLLVIPSDLGYGDTGSGPIAGGETLVFVVDLVSVTAPPEPPACRNRDVSLKKSGRDIVVGVSGRPDSKPRINISDGDPPCSLQRVNVLAGKGAKAKAGDRVEVHYVGISWSTSKEFDASWNGDAKTFEFVLGGGNVIQGWDQGVVGMREGGRRLLVIPGDLGYGAQGSGPDIGPFETLVFVVDMIEIRSS